MLRMKAQKTLLLAIIFLSTISIAQQVSPDDWGAPQVKVTHEKGRWIIAGKTNQVVLNESDLAIKINAGPVAWVMSSSEAEEMIVRWQGENNYLSLTDAGIKNFSEYKTGYKSGVKIRLEEFQAKDKGKLDLKIVLTVCLEGPDEELVFDAVAIEGEATLRQLDWPKALDAVDVDYTVLSHVRGNLLPRNWPEEYHPFRSFTGEQEADIVADTISVIVSNLIECWSMSWWGFQKGTSAMMLIVETPDDASYKFSHPPGGPTVIGPRWLASLRSFDYTRSVRMCFFPEGNYVTLSKRYRQHVKDIGLFVSLNEKIARQPLVRKLIGTPHLRQYALITDKSFKALPGLLYAPAARRYDPNDPKKNFGLRTFDELAQDLRELKDRGIDRLHATLCAWPQFGYNRQHPDPLPPAPKAGGWEGMKRWVDACKELGYTTALHTISFAITILTQLHTIPNWPFMKKIR